MKTRNVTLPDGRVVEAVPMNVTDKEVVAKYGGQYFRQSEQTSRQNLRQTVARLAKSNQNRVYTEVPHPLNTDYWVDYALDAVTGGNRIETAKKSAEAYQTAYNQLQYDRAKAQEQESIAAAAKARRSGLGAEVLHKAKLAGQAGLRGAAMAFDLKALPDMLYSLTTGLQVPNMQRDNLTTTGQVPTTHLGRYMRSGIEGLGAGVTGASGVIGAGRQVAKAVTPTWAARQAARSNVPTIRASQAVREGSIMRRSAAGGLAGGLGSEAGADLTRSPDAPEGTTAGRLLGGLLGGAAGAAVGRLGHLSTTRTDAAQYAVKGLLPEELQAAQAGQQLAASQGVNTTLNQHLRRGSNLDKLVEINANRPVGEKTQEVLRHQPEQIKALAQQQVDALPGQATTDTTALGTRLTTAAGQRIDQAEGNAKLAWRTGYGRQMQAAQDDANRALAQASTRARAQQGVANQAEVRLRTAQQRRQEAEATNQQAAEHGYGQRIAQRVTYSKIRQKGLESGRRNPEAIRFINEPVKVGKLQDDSPYYQEGTTASVYNGVDNEAFIANRHKLMAELREKGISGEPYWDAINRAEAPVIAERRQAILNLAETPKPTDSFQGVLGTAHGSKKPIESFRKDWIPNDEDKSYMDNSFGDDVVYLAEKGQFWIAPTKQEARGNRMPYYPATQNVNSDFNNAFVLTPESAIRLASLVKTRNLDELGKATAGGADVVKALRENGYDGLIVRGFKEDQHDRIWQISDATGLKSEVFQDQVVAFNPERLSIRSQPARAGMTGGERPLAHTKPTDPALAEIQAEQQAAQKAQFAQRQAQQALANEKGARKAARTAGQLTPDEVGEIASYLRNAARENPNMQEGAWAEGLARSLYKPDGTPITSPQQLANILKRGVVASPEQRVGESTVNKASEAIFGGIRGKALDMLREKSEAIARADEAYKAVKTQEVNPLREGVVGRLAGTGKGWENPGVNADYLIGELDKGLLAGQTRSPFTTLRQEFSKLPLDQRVQAYGALQDAAKTWIATKVDRAMKASSNRTDSDIATALTREFGVPGDNHSAILGTKRVLEDWAVMKGLPPKEFSKGFLNALRTFAAAANRPSSTSGGTRGDVRKVMRLPIVDSVGRVNVIQPLRQLFIGANNRYEADAFRFIDDVLTDPNGLDMLLKMAKEPTVNRTTAQLLSSWMATSGQGSRAEVNTTESPE